MTEAPIYTTDSYIGLLCQIGRLRSDNVMAKDRKETILIAIITTADALAATIKYKKIKADLDLYDISGATRFLDKTMNGDLLQSFFGDNELWVMEHQLKQITWEINETTKAINFDWQQLF